MTSSFDARPIVVAIAGPNGAGKATFYEAHLQPAGLRFVNADDLAREKVARFQQGPMLEKFSPVPRWVPRGE